MSTPSRDKLSLNPFNISSKKGIPKLRDITHKVRVIFSEESLVEYQRKHNTNSHYLKLSLDLVPNKWAASAIQQSILVNCLKNETHIDFHYPTSNSNLTDEKLIHELQLNVEKELRAELNDIEKILLQSKDTFVLFLTTFLINEFDSFHEEVSNTLTFSPDFLIEKNKNVFLNWPKLINTIHNVSKVGSSLPQPTKQSFKFVDINRLKSLAAILGHTPEPIKTTWWEKEHLVKVGAINDTFNEDCADALLKQFHTVLSQLQDDPMGYLFKNEEVSKQVLNFDKKKASLKKSIVEVRAKRKKSKQQTEQKYADILVKEGFAERLRLAMEQNLYWKPIFFETLTKQLIEELNSMVVVELNHGKPCENILHYADTSQTNDSFSQECENKFIQESFSPSQLALEINGLIIKFFKNHPWLHKINCQHPKTFILDQIGEDSTGEAVLFYEEFIIIKQLFTGPPIPNKPEIVFNVHNFKQQLDDLERP